jgi:hypothetical protein
VITKEQFMQIKVGDQVTLGPDRGINYHRMTYGVTRGVLPNNLSIMMENWCSGREFKFREDNDWYLNSTSEEINKLDNDKRTIEILCPCCGELFLKNECDYKIVEEPRLGPSGEFIAWEIK